MLFLRHSVVLTVAGNSFEQFTVSVITDTSES